MISTSTLYTEYNVTLWSVVHEGSPVSDYIQISANDTTHKPFYRRLTLALSRDATSVNDGDWPRRTSTYAMLRTH